MAKYELTDLGKSVLAKWAGEDRDHECRGCGTKVPPHETTTIPGASGKEHGPYCAHCALGVSPEQIDEHRERDVKKGGYSPGGVGLEMSEKIPGGLAEGKKPEDFDPKKLKEGTKVETEHTSDKGIAEEIAMDHLTEDKDYYMKLKTIEKKCEAKVQPWNPDIKKPKIEKAKPTISGEFGDRRIKGDMLHWSKLTSKQQDEAKRAFVNQTPVSSYPGHNKPISNEHYHYQVKRDGSIGGRRHLSQVGHHEGMLQNLKDMPAPKLTKAGEEFVNKCGFVAKVKTPQIPALPGSTPLGLKPKKTEEIPLFPHEMRSMEQVAGNKQPNRLIGHLKGADKLISRIKKSEGDRWLLLLSDKVRDVAKAKNVAYSYTEKTEGTIQKHLFTIGKCALEYQVMGGEARILLTEAPQVNKIDAALVKALYRGIQMFSAGEGLIRKSKDSLHPWKHGYKVGDKVKLHPEALAHHARSIPAQAGYTKEGFAWREHLGGLKDKVGTVSRTFEHSGHVNVDFDNGTIGIDHRSIVPHTGETKKSEYTLTEKGEELIKRLYGSNYARTWQEGLGGQELRREKRRMQTKRGYAHKKPIKNRASYRLRTQNARMMGYMEEGFGKMQLTPAGQEFVKAFGLNSQASKLKHTPGVSMKGRVNIAARAGMPKKAPGVVSPKPSPMASKPSVVTKAAVVPKPPKVAIPKISTPKFGKGLDGDDRDRLDESNRHVRMEDKANLQVHQLPEKVKVVPEKKKVDKTQGDADITPAAAGSGQDILNS